MSIFSYIKSHAVLATTIAIIAVVAAVISGRMASKTANQGDTASNLKQVSLVNVDNFRADSGTVRADGVVQSVSQVDLKSQVSGPLSSVNVALGDRVVAGQVIAQIENADLRAQLAQAQTSWSIESVSAESAKKSAIDSVRDAYEKVDDVVRTQLDQFVLNAPASGPRLSSYVTDSKLNNAILTGRIDLVSTLRDWKAVVDGLDENSSDADIAAAISLSDRNVNTVRALLDNVSKAVNDAASIAVSSDLSTLNSWKNIVTGARSTVSQISTNLTNAERTFESALATHGIAAGAPTSVAASGVQSLQAQLAKTIFTAPISGTIGALPLRVGELATPGQLIATIVGPGGLEIDAFVSGDEITRIEKGANATIGSGISGTVTSVAPIVSQTTRKAEIKVRVDNPENTNLVVGQNASLSIIASAAAEANATGTQSAVYRLPIQNVKIVPGEAYVFSVDANSKAIKNNVTLGRVEGDFVEITRGLSPGMNIISPVYEINEGQEVNVR